MTGATRPRWQFTTRGLLIAILAASLLFAVHRSFGAAGTLLVVWVGLMVAGHVAANAWGTGVRAARDDPDPASARHAAAHVVRLPASRLSRTALFGRRWAAVSALCSVVGAAAAVAGLLVSGWSVGPTGIALGGLSAAVIGAWGGFLAVSFIDVARQAWREATTPPGPPAPRK